MKAFMRKVWKRFLDWLKEPEMTLEKFQSLESKKYRRKGDRHGFN